MAVLDDFKGASILCKVAFILLLIASMFTCISYKTTSWGYEANNPFLTNTNHMGLWRMCGDGDKPEGCETIDGWANDWFGVVQAFVTIGFVGTLVTFFLVILYIFVGKCQKNGEVGMAAGIIAIATGIFYLIGCIVFAAKWDEYYKDDLIRNFDYKLGYSFSLSIIALVLEIIGGVLMAVEGKGGGGGGGKTQASA